MTIEFFNFYASDSNDSDNSDDTETDQNRSGYYLLTNITRSFFDTEYDFLVLMTLRGIKTRRQK